MKLVKFLTIALVVAGGAIGVIADDLKVTDITKSAKLSILNEGAYRAYPWKIFKFPEQLKGLPCVYTPRGDWKKPGMKFSFKVNQPVTVYLFVHIRGDYVPDGWDITDMKVEWPAGKSIYHDLVYKKDFAAGQVNIPAHTGMTPDKSAYGLPHLAIIKAKYKDLN